MIRQKKSFLFINVIFKKIDNSKTPKFYFSPEIYKYSSDKKEETKRLKKYYKTEEYDERTTFLFIVLARIYVTSNEISVRKEILKYWDDKCRKASLQKNDYNYYTNGFYNFIHEIETWAIEKEDKNLQIESIKFTNILLNAHLPRPRKLGERESDEDERVYISYETLKSLWRTIRTCIDAGDEEMFKRYWQIVNNMSSRKYESRFISKPKNFDDEKIKFLVLHFACCAYLIASKRYELLKYALDNPNKALNKKSTLYRDVMMDRLDLYSYQFCENDIICFPSFTSTSLNENLNFKPTNNSKKINNNEIEEKNFVKMIISYNPQGECIPQGLDVTNESKYSHEKEILLFPFTFLKIDKVEINTGKENDKHYIYLTIINKGDILEEGLNNNYSFKLIEDGTKLVIDKNNDLTCDNNELYYKMNFKCLKDDNNEKEKDVNIEKVEKIEIVKKDEKEKNIENVQSDIKIGKDEIEKNKKEKSISCCNII